VCDSEIFEPVFMGFGEQTSGNLGKLSSLHFGVL
jgi:hypothetical protein